MRAPKTRLHGDRVARVPADTDQAMSTLYAQNYRALVQLAALLVGDPDTAEKIVQDAFVDLHRAWPSQPGPEAALAQLRRTVIARSRSVPAVPAAACVAAESPAFVAALRRLPARQREVLVLHYFAELTEAQIAAATGIGPDAVHSHIAQAFSLLRAELPAVA
jgi:DNA-directed RNA polymerase specialized sigma24 family protein